MAKKPKLTPFDLVAVPKKKGKRREKPKTWKQVEKQAAGPKQQPVKPKVKAAPKAKAKAAPKPKPKSAPAARARSLKALATPTPKPKAKVDTRPTIKPSKQVEAHVAERKAAQEKQRDKQTKALGAQDLFTPGKTQTTKNLSKAGKLNEKSQAKKVKAVKEAKNYPRDPGARKVVKQQQEKRRVQQGRRKESPTTRNVRKFATGETRTLNKRERDEVKPYLPKGVKAEGLLTENEAVVEAKRGAKRKQARIRANTRTVKAYETGPKKGLAKKPERVKDAEAMLAVDSGRNAKKLKALKVLNAPFNVTGLTAQKAMQGNLPVAAFGKAVKDVSKGKEADWKKILGETAGLNKAGEIGKKTAAVAGTAGNLVLDPLNLVGAGAVKVPLKAGAQMAKQQAKRAAAAEAKRTAKEAGEAAAKKAKARGLKPKQVEAVAKREAKRSTKERQKRAAKKAYKEVDEVVNARRGTTSAPNKITKDSAGRDTAEKTPSRKKKGNPRPALKNNQPRVETERAWKQSRAERAVKAKEKAVEKLEPQLTGMRREMKKLGYKADEIEKAVAKERADVGKKAMQAEYKRPIPGTAKRKAQPLERKNPNMGDRLAPPTVRTLNIRSARVPKLTLSPEGRRIAGTKLKVSSTRLDKHIRPTPVPTRTELLAPGKARISRMGAAQTAAVDRAVNETRRSKNRQGRVARLSPRDGAGKVRGQVDYRAKQKGATKSSSDQQRAAARELYGSREAAESKIEQATERIQKLADKSDRYATKRLVGGTKMSKKGRKKLYDDYEKGVDNEVTREMKKLSDEIGYRQMREGVEEMLDPGAKALRRRRVNIEKATAKTERELTGKAEKAKKDASTQRSTQDKARRDIKRDQGKTDTVSRKVRFETGAGKREKLIAGGQKILAKKTTRKEREAKRAEDAAKAEVRKTQDAAKGKVQVASGAKQAQPPATQMKAVRTSTGKAKSKMTLAETNLGKRKAEAKELRATPSIRPERKKPAVKPTSKTPTLKPRKESIEEQMDDTRSRDMLLKSYDDHAADFKKNMGVAEKLVAKGKTKDLTPAETARLRNSIIKARNSKEMMDGLEPPAPKPKPVPKVKPVEGKGIPAPKKAKLTDQKRGQVKRAARKAETAKRQLTKAEDRQLVYDDLYNRAQKIIDRNLEKADEIKAGVPKLKEKVSSATGARKQVQQTRQKLESSNAAIGRKQVTRSRRIARSEGEAAVLSSNLSRANDALQRAAGKEAGLLTRAEIFQERADYLSNMRRRNTFEPRPDEGATAYASRMREVAGELTTKAEAELAELKKVLDEIGPLKGVDKATADAIAESLDMQLKLAAKLDEYAAAIQKTASKEAQRHLSRYTVADLDEGPPGMRWLFGNKDRFSMESADDAKFGERLVQTKQQKKNIREQRKPVKQTEGNKTHPEDEIERSKPLESLRRGLISEANKVAIARFFANFHASGRVYNGQKLAPDEHAFTFKPGEGMVHVDENLDKIAKTQDVRILTEGELNYMQNAMRISGWQPTGYSRYYLNLKSGMTHLFVTLSPGSWTRNVIGDTFNQLLGGTGISGIVGGWQTAANAWMRHAATQRLTEDSGRLVKRIAAGDSRKVKTVKVDLGDGRSTTKRIDKRRKVAVRDTNDEVVYRTRAQLLTEAQHLGVTGGMVGGELKGTFGKRGRIARVAAGREMGPRTGSFIEHRRAMNISDAANRTNRYHFDYKDLTRAEKTMRDLMFPFFTWTARNARLQFSEFLRHPGAYNSLLRVMDMQAREAGYDNILHALDQMDPKDIVQLPIQFTEDVAGSVALPAGVIVDLLQGAESGKLEDILLALPKNIKEMSVSLLNPMWKALVEMSSGKDLFFNKDIRTYGKDGETVVVKPNAPFQNGVTLFGTSITPRIDQLGPLSDLLGVERGGDGNLKMDAMAKKFLSYFGPQAQQLMFATTPLGPNATQGKETSLLGKLTGVRLIPTNEKARAQRAMSKLYDERNALDAANEKMRRSGKDGKYTDIDAYVKRLRDIDKLNTDIQDYRTALGLDKDPTIEQELMEELAKDKLPPDVKLEFQKERQKMSKEIRKLTGKSPAALTPTLKELEENRAKPAPRSQTPAQRGYKVKPSAKPKKIKPRSSKVIASTPPPPASASQGQTVTVNRTASVSAPTGKISGKVKLKRSQRKVAEEALHTAEKMRATDFEKEALIAAGLVESNLENVNHGDRDSLGFLQQRPSQGWGTADQVRDVSYATKKFIRTMREFRKQGKITKGMTPGQAAQAVQRSAYPGKYDQRLKEARSIIKAYGAQADGSIKSEGGVKATLKERPALKSALADVMKTGYVDTNALAAALLQPPETTAASTKQPKVSAKGGGSNPWKVPAKYGLTVTSGKRPGSITTSGNISDHAGQGDGTMARDFGGSVKQMDKAAKEMAAFLGVKNWKGGDLTVVKNGYRYQLLYRTNTGGNHYDHIHLGRKRV